MIVHKNAHRMLRFVVHEPGGDIDCVRHKLDMVLLQRRMRRPEVRGNARVFIGNQRQVVRNPHSQPVKLSNDFQNGTFGGNDKRGEFPRENMFQYVGNRVAGDVETPFRFAVDAVLFERFQKTQAPFTVAPAAEMVLEQADFTVTVFVQMLVRQPDSLPMIDADAGNAVGDFIDQHEPRMLLPEQQLQ